jgi:hypothetical protein
MSKERNQNLVIGDNVSLRLFTYNSNQRQNVNSVEKVEIFHLDEYSITEDNPEGRVLVKTFSNSEVVVENDDLGGHYSVNFILENDRFVIGNYIDVWSVNFNESQSGTVTNEFAILPDLWFASDMPIIYDFSFGFRPNRIRYGERRWINIEITPNVPNISDLRRYYVNLAISSPLKIYIEKLCGDCVPKEKDLRMVVDGESIQHRRNAEGSFFLDTESLEMNVGIYNVWFEMEFGENKYLSENLQLEIY